MRNRIFLLFAILFLTSSMAHADRTGSIVAAGVTVGASANTFASAYCDEINGCPQIVADNTARDAITSARRVIGMTAYVTGTGLTYRLVGGITNSDWQLVDLSGSGFTDGGANIYTTTSTDKVGIGTFAPANALQVVGTVQATSFSGDGSGLTGISAGVSGSSGGMAYQVVDLTAYSNEAQNTTHSTNILTYNGNQYLGYIDSDRKMQLCKRPTGGQFTCYKYDGTGGRPSISAFKIDNHNTIALGVDDDGYIHVTYDMHAVALKYRVSTSPEDVSNLGATDNFLGTNEDAVTYPIFFNDNAGNLYVLYRNGVSGNGNHYLYKYDSSSTSWSAVSGTGAAGLFVDGITDAISVYMNIPVVDSTNTAHFAWIWRNDASGTTSKDVGYVKWDITNGTFKRYNGTTQTIPIKDSNDLPAATIASGSGLLNGTSKYGIALDSNNYPSIVYNKMDAFGNTNVYMANFDGSAFTEYGPISKSAYPDVTLDSDGTAVIASPAIVFDDEDNALIFYRNTTLAQGIIVYESPVSDLQNWDEFSIYPGSVGKQSIAFDGSLWKASKIMNMIISPVPRLLEDTSGVDGNNGVDLGIVTWDSSKNNRNILPFNMTRIVSDDDITLNSTGGDINLIGANLAVRNGNMRLTTETNDSTAGLTVRNSDLRSTLTVLNNGNIGIGTTVTAPGVKLQIVATDAIQLQAFRNTVPYSSTGGAFIMAGANNGTAITSGARIGVFCISGAADTSDTINSGACMEGFAGSAFSGSNAETNLRFTTAPSGSTTRSTRMTIMGNGNVGIGTTAPLGGLAVMNGNVGVGTWSPTQKVQVIGTITATSFMSSDGSAGVTGSTCTAWKNGLCTSL